MSVAQTLITGATGFIGARLLKAGDRALVRKANVVPGAVVGNLLDFESLAAACSGIETVFHCAGYAHAFSSSDPDVHWPRRFTWGWCRTGNIRRKWCKVATNL